MKQQIDSNDILLSLPLDLLKIIFSFLSFKEYSTFIRISHVWSDMLSNVITHVKLNHSYRMNEKLFHFIFGLTNISSLDMKDFKIKGKIRNKDIYLCDLDYFKDVSKRFSNLKNLRKLKISDCTYEQIQIISSLSKLQKLEIYYYNKRKE